MHIILKCLKGLLVLIVLTTGAKANTPDSFPQLQIKIPFSKAGDSLNTKKDTIMIKVASDTITSTPSGVCIPCTDKTMNGQEWLLTFLPALVFILLLLSLAFGGLRKFDLKKAMSESTFPTIITNNPKYTGENITNPALSNKPNIDEIIPPTIELTYTVKKDGEDVPPDPHPSISRYVAFISSILTIVVALALACFFIYYYVSTGCPPDLTGMSTLLIALGLGLVPYVANKVAAAVKRDS